MSYDKFKLINAARNRQDLTLDELSPLIRNYFKSKRQDISGNLGWRLSVECGICKRDRDIAMNSVDLLSDNSMKLIVDFYCDIIGNSCYHCVKYNDISDGQWMGTSILVADSVEDAESEKWIKSGYHDRKRKVPEEIKYKQNLGSLSIDKVYKLRRDNTRFYHLYLPAETNQRFGDAKRSSIDFARRKTNVGAELPTGRQIIF